MLIEKRTLSDQIYEILKSEILQQKIQFDEKLVNRALQERFGVSSTPIRDAINRLSLDGLVDSISNSGAKVISFTLDFALEINELLFMIISSGMRLSFKKEKPEEICKDLEYWISMQRENIGTDKYFEYDYKFHKTFIDYCKNKSLKEIYKKYHVLHEILVRSFYGSNVIEEQIKSIKDHEDILNKLRDGNVNQAIAITQQHYDKAEELFRSKFENSK
jgi:DNA-binding GntR family transcriptional regulator